MSTTRRIHEMQTEIRQLAELMVRLDRQEQNAHVMNNITREIACRERRELTQERRSALLREVWDAERGEL